MLRNLIPFDEFKGMNIKIFTVVDNDTWGLVGDADSYLKTGLISTGKGFDGATQEEIKNPNKDAAWSYPALLATNYMYNIHFKEGLDWDHMLMQPSYEAEATDAPIVIRLNYTEVRELFEIEQMITNKVNVGQYKEVPIDSLVDLNDTNNPFYKPKSTCNFGEWHHDPDNKAIFVCVNGKKTNKFESIDLNGIYCRITC